MKRGATLATLRLLAVVSAGMLTLELWAWLDVQFRDEVVRVKLERFGVRVQASQIVLNGIRHRKAFKRLAKLYAVEFYPICTDGFKKAEKFGSCRATLRRIRGL